MKRFLLGFLSLLCVSASFGQISVEGKGSNVVVGGYSDFEIKYYVTVLNTTDELMVVDAERQTIQAPDGTRSQFCWGELCYPPNVDKAATPEEIDAQGKNESFYAIYSPNGQSGVAKFRYIFTKSSDASVTASIDVTFDATQQSVGIGETGSVVNQFEAQPSVTNGLTTFKYSVLSNNPVLELRNLTGQMIHQAQLPGAKGAVVFDASTLPKGIYMYSLKVDGKLESTKKLIVY